MLLKSWKLFLMYVVGNPSKDDKNQEPNVQARQFQGNSKGVPKVRNYHHSTPLEISMYVLLAAFCCAIVVSNPKFT